MHTLVLYALDRSPFE